MNNSIRCLAILVSAAICAGGWVSVSREYFAAAGGQSGSVGNELNADYKFGSADLYQVSFSQLEEAVCADAAVRFPNSRVELGSVKAEPRGVSMTVILFGPNRQTQAVLYALVPNKDSWKISSTRRLWFVPPSQITRGLRI